MEALKKCLTYEEDDYGMKKLRQLADNCPACIMSAILQAKIQSKEDFFESGPLDYGFNYRQELDSWMEAKTPSV